MNRTKSRNKSNQAFLDAIPDMFFRVDRNGKYLDFRAGKGIRPYVPRSQFMGKKVADVLPAQIARKIVHEIRQALRTGTLGRLEYDLLEDGDRCWYEARFTRASSREVIVVVRDISDRRKAEDALRFTQFAIDRASEPAFWLRPDGSVFYVNEAACRALGYACDELLRMTVSDINPDYPAARWAAHWKEMRQKGSLTFESRHRSKQGRIFPVEITTNYLEFEGKEYICAFVRDISYHKQVEDELRGLSLRVISSRDEERRRIGRELHDNTAQKLVALGMNLSLLEKATAPNSKAGHYLSECVQLSQESLRDIRTLSLLLHPPVLDEAGLIPALKLFVGSFTKRSGIKVSMNVDADVGRLSQEVETALFRLVQECLTNVHRHSGSQTASIRIGREAAGLFVQISDAGRGTLSRRARSSKQTIFLQGVGLAGLREEITQLGGRLEMVPSHPGTIIRATFPSPG